MLSERQRLILSAIVDDYIRSAEPVGCSISKRGDVAYSPATIRNEMSDLEELGYLERASSHIAQPSHKGYRYYVDHLVHVKEIMRKEVDRLKKFFAEDEAAGGSHSPSRDDCGRDDQLYVHRT